MKKLSLALATHNEESNIVECIESCRGLVDEVVVVDGSSTDNTASLALTEGATVIRTQNISMFHINKQKAIEACTGEWILQLDADERVTLELAAEIRQIIQMTNEEINKYQENLKEKKLFERHQKLVQSHVIPAEAGIQSKITDSKNRDYSLDPSLRWDDTQKQTTNYELHTTPYNAFFVPRLNFFLGGYLRSGGVYPDGVIRLIRKGRAFLPCKSVHELMEVEGKTGWLANPLIHKDSPTFQRYLERNSRYIDHLVEELKVKSLKLKAQNKSFQLSTFSFQLLQGIDWLIIKPIVTFFSILIRHKGILDGWRGVVFAFFSAIRFARAYFRYIEN